MRKKGHHVVTQFGDQASADFSVDRFDAVVVGGSIHMGKYPEYLHKFVKVHSDWVNNVPSALFTVCMAINSRNEKSREEAKHFSDQLSSQTGWQPQLTGVFAGAVKYTQYNFITRFIMKLISKREGGSTNTSVDHEYTDWEAVVRFTENFLEEIVTLEKV